MILSWRSPNFIGIFIVGPHPNLIPLLRENQAALNGILQVCCPVSTLGTLADGIVGSLPSSPVRYQKNQARAQVKRSVSDPTSADHPRMPRRIDTLATPQGGHIHFTIIFVFTLFIVSKFDDSTPLIISGDGVPDLSKAVRKIGTRPIFEGTYSTVYEGEYDGQKVSLPR
jgi:hypothetical protein